MAAFDFDGTLARGDSLIPFLVSVRGRRRVGAALSALGPSIAWAMARGGDEARERAKEALVGRLLRGVPADEVAAQGEAFAAQLVEGRLRPLTAERVAWHRSEGHQLVIVSASLTAYLEPVGATLGFDQVLATSLEVGDDGRLTGRLAGGNVRGPEKAERLRAWLASASASWDASASASSDAGSAECEVWAYGDSTGDHHLFALADHPFLVGRRSITVWRT